jgi:two-component system, cell cycle response regulator
LGMEESRILIVDDEDDNRKILRILLESLSFIVLEATCGTDALEIIRESPIDLILLDVMMPGISGIDFCERLTELDKFNMPIIFLSAKAEKKDILLGLQVGAYDYLTKPFDIDLLEKKVTTAIAFGKKLKQLQTTNSSLKIKSITDTLTGLFNRSYLNQLIQEIEQGARVFSSVMMIDIDFFKEINDNYGHLFGDTVLKGVSKCILNSINMKNDAAFRYGGDELLIFTTNEAEHCERIAQSICSEISSIPFKVNERHIPITVSIGVSAVAESQKFEDIMLKVDNALYSAKNKGRNRTFAFK